MSVAIERLSIPSPLVVFPCGSMSISKTLLPRIDSEAPRLTAVVVLPTPPFWLTIAIVRVRVIPSLHPKFVPRETSSASGRFGVNSRRRVGPALGGGRFT